MKTCTKSKTGCTVTDRERSNMQEVEILRLQSQKQQATHHPTKPASERLQSWCMTLTKKASAFWSKCDTAMTTTATSLSELAPRARARCVADLSPFQRVVFTAICEGQYGYADVRHEGNATVIDRR